MFKNNSPRNWVIIPAAGIGSRMQASIPKQYLKIQNTTLLEHSIHCFLSHPKFEQVNVAIAKDDEWFSALSISFDARVSVYEGGGERAESVENGLKYLSGKANDDDWVWVHDAARPCLGHQDIDVLLQAMENGSEGVVLSVPVSDTIKKTGDSKGVIETIDRKRLWRAMTPQVFRYSDLKLALEHCGKEKVLVTDESSALEYYGRHPDLVEGSGRNIKVTRPDDLLIAADIRKRMDDENKKGGLRKVKNVRIGSGYDVHAFGEGAFVTLGGCQIPFGQGLIAHSDGDVLVHALMDALLGALALGDIGQHFPDSDPKWKGANSMEMLEEVRRKIHQHGYTIGNVDTTIIAQAPKMSPFIVAMQENIAGRLLVGTSDVGVKATTTEKLGFTGREEGIACQATVLLVPITQSEAENEV